jgi:hypothetical protein
MSERDEDVSEISKEVQEHRDLLNHIQTLMSTRSGVAFAKYLLKSFDVGEQPHRMCRGEELIDRVSFLRAGNSIYKLLMEANPELTGQILASIEKEKIYVFKTTNT